MIDDSCLCGAGAAGANEGLGGKLGGCIELKAAEVEGQGETASVIFQQLCSHQFV